MKRNVIFLSIAMYVLLGALGLRITAQEIIPFPTLEECESEYEGKITICHATSSEDNPYTVLTIACEALYGQNGNGGHLNEDGSPKAGHEDDLMADENGLCAQTEPSPSPTIEPSVSPTPTPTVEPSPTPSVAPTPTPSVEPSPTPTDEPEDDREEESDTDDDNHDTEEDNDDNENSKTASLSYESSCDNEFDVSIEVYEDGEPVSNKVVTFIYTTAKTAKTNNDGKAQVTFPKVDDRVITAQVDGYPDQSLFATMPRDCDSNSSSNENSGSNSSSNDSSDNKLNSSSNQIASVKAGQQIGGRGQVLGISTLADTGSTQEIIVDSLLLLLSLGLSLQVKKMR